MAVYILPSNAKLWWDYLVIRNVSTLYTCNVEFHSSSNMNIIEWLVSTVYLLCHCSLILLSPFPLA